MKKLFFLFLFIPLTALASLKNPKASSSEKVSLGEIKDALGEKARQADSIAASITSLEKEIGMVNNRYLERSKENQSLEKKLEMLQEGIAERLAELEGKQDKARKLARLYALEGQDEEDENLLLKKTILVRLLKERMAELDGLKAEARELGQTFSAYQKKLKETRANEESLYAVILDLENQKKHLSKSYITSLESKNELEEKLENALAKQKTYSAMAKVKNGAVELNLISPLDNFVNFTGGKKGVTFKYDSKAPIKATAGGEVVYSGELASYGKVIMVDHGHEVRSVILGDLQVKVKKGDKVSQGQILGYTMAEPGIKKSLYYEVRKKNIAQNTLQWLQNNNKLANI